MLFRDAPTVEVSVRVAAPPEAVWALVTDIGVPARFSVELQSAHWLDGAARPVVGARFRGHSAHPALGEWSTVSEVVEVQEGRRWVWQVQGPGDGPTATWAFEVDPGRGAVTLRQWARMGPGPSGLTPAIAAAPEREARIVAHRLEEWRAGMSANLEGIRSLLERGGPGGSATVE